LSERPGVRVFLGFESLKPIPNPSFQKGPGGPGRFLGQGLVMLKARYQELKAKDLSDADLPADVLRALMQHEGVGAGAL